MIDKIYTIIARLVMALDLNEWAYVRMHEDALSELGLTPEEIERYIDNYQGFNDVE